MLLHSMRAFSIWKIRIHRTYPYHACVFLCVCVVDIIIFSIHLPTHTHLTEKEHPSASNEKNNIWLVVFVLTFVDV